MKRSIIGLFFVVSSCLVSLTCAQDTLYINRDTTSIATVSFQKAAFNLDTNFQRINAVLDFPENTLIEFVVANNDTVPHEVLLPDGSLPLLLQPNAAQLVQISSLPYGTYAVQSLTAQGAFLGAGAILRVGITGISFTWDLWEQDPSLTYDFGNGTITTLPAVYRPTVFAINGGVDPMDMMSSAVITGSVGDTITISIVNNGNMIHPIHFHGYHVELMQSTQQASRIGWKKDSFPVFVKEGMTLRLIPHQPGEFPVHNHNLVATLFNNGYPLGMITMLMIMP